MNTIKSILVAAVLLIGTSAFAVAQDYGKTGNPTSQELQGLLKNPGFEVNQDITAQVKFVLNENHELVVLSVNTNSITVEKYVKNRLNYKKLAAELEIGKEYKVDVMILSEES